MVHSKLSFFLVVFMLITAGPFMTELRAQDTEENNTPAQEFIKKAEELVEQNRIEEAIDLYERITKGYPEDSDSHVELAKLYTRTDQHEKAAQTYNQLLEADPDNIKHQDALVNSLQAAGKQDEAFEIAQAYIQTEPEVGVHYARLAKLYEAEGNEAEAIANYKKATTFGYGDKDIYLMLAEHYFLNEDMGAAEEALKNAIPSTTSSWDREKIGHQLVNLYRYQGNLEEMLEKAEAAGILTFTMERERARHFRNTGELEKAATAFKKAYEMTNSSFDRDEILTELFNVYLKQDNTDLALDFYESKISEQIQSRSISTRFSSSGITVRFGGDDTREILINAYKNRGKLEELQAHFERKLEKGDTSSAVLEMLAEIYWDTNDYQKAAEAYHLLGKAEPIHRRNIRGLYYAAAAFHKSNQPDILKIVLNEADTALTQLAPTDFMEDGSFLGALATICLKNEMYDPALKLADKGVAVTETDDWEMVYLYALLAKSYLALKHYYSLDIFCFFYGHKAGKRVSF